MTGIETPELWCVDLAAAGAALHTLEERTPRLSAADRARAADLSDLTVRAEWVATHIALRLLIERAAGTQWRRATFVRSERGKPHLDGAPLAFSISHAPGLALIGLAPGGSIGVDVERTRRVRVGEARRARIEEAGAALSNATAARRRQRAISAGMGAARGRRQGRRLRHRPAVDAARHPRRQR